ncbi:MULTISPECIES: phage major capsid protein [unclassified Neptuniibacter]|uniref:phage major capsid protein n=1 Tax=unclassified Neptuniibacter TaxID=2630693 RepID=UPI000C6BCB44|nr:MULTISPECIES: phage major capsid protein [unclassified Neptuniibacter]MAY42390.1 phage major capsid protein [Oceanospirillaceae bacterium]|tara:strand:- start:13907 stop:15775 length:1869 start_codon:yes stop_codon:yes gene_type:complete
MSKKVKTSNLAVLREIEGQELQRELAVVSDSINEETRTVEIAASSEYPVPRWFGEEILDHSPNAVRLGRMKAGAPLLEMHSRWEQIGVVEDAWLESGRLRARVRFSRNESAEPVWQDVVDGIRRNVSVGYQIFEMVLQSQDESGEVYRVTDWEPYEISFVSVAADPTVGVGRSHAVSNITIRSEKMAKPEKKEEVKAPAAGAEGSQRSGAEPQGPSAEDIAAGERKRIMEINEIGRQFGQRSLAQESVSGGHTVDQFRALVMERVKPVAPPTYEKEGDKGGLHSAREIGIDEKELGDYSLMRAINAAANNDWSKAGLEREVSLAIADASGKEARGFFMPAEVMVQRQLEKQTSGKGGELVATELMGNEFIDVLRNKAMVAQLGAKIMSGLVGDVDIPKKTSSGNFYWLSEDEDVSDSDFDFTTLPLSPKCIAGAIPVTRKLRKQSSLNVENLIREDLITGIGVAIDLALLLGDGVKEPLGILNAVGTNAVTYPAGGMDFNSAVSMETKIATYNADIQNMAYLTNAVQRGAAKTKQVFDGTGERLWQNNEVNGYMAHATGQMPADTWAFGDWSQLMIALWGVLDLKVDTSTKAASDGLILRVFQDCDGGVRRPESFTVGRKTV